MKKTNIIEIIMMLLCACLLSCAPIDNPQNQTAITQQSAPEPQKIEWLWGGNYSPYSDKLAAYYNRNSNPEARDILWEVDAMKLVAEDGYIADMFAPVTFASVEMIKRDVGRLQLRFDSLMELVRFPPIDTQLILQQYLLDHQPPRVEKPSQKKKRKK